MNNSTEALSTNAERKSFTNWREAFSG
jgi:hypothetical protein